MRSGNDLTESQLGAVDELRSRFFHACEDTSFADEFDERDLERFGYDDWWVYNFFLLGKKKIDMALQKITNSLRWRKEFGVNDITEESFSNEVHEKAAVYPHGIDKEGRTILWFDVKMHNKKIPGQTNIAKRYLVYWLERLQRQYPSEKITVLEDMSAAGISNMDLEVVKFKIRCFEEYFPFLVDMLFIYEMAWILNAIWKIVEKLLSDEAKSHIKFIRKGDLKNYIEPATLPIHMGGTDTFKWVFKPKSVEDEEFQSILYTDDIQELNATDSDPFSNGTHATKTSTNGINSNSSCSNHAQSTDNKVCNRESPTNDVQIRPSATNGDSHIVSSNADSVVNDTFQLATPLADDKSHRKVRQVRLQNGIVQERPKKMKHHIKHLFKVQFAESEDEELSRRKLNERNGGLRLLRRVKGKDCYVGPLLTITPGEQLDFSLNPSKTDESSSELYTRFSLQNTTDNTIAFKVKTTSPDRYRVKPSAGPIKPNANVNVSVYISSAHKEAIAKDKFLVMSTGLHQVIKSPAEMTDFWKKVSKEDIIEHRLKCAYVPTEEEKERIPEDPNIALKKQIVQLNDKISTLTDLTTTQHSALQHKLNMGLVLLFLAFLVMMYLILSIPSGDSASGKPVCHSHEQMYSDVVTNS